MHDISVWVIAAAAIALMLARPRQWPEAIWPAAGAVLLVALGLVKPAAAAAWAGSGWEVYLFLAGMMMLAELGRREGVFDWLARHALTAAGGSRARLFGLIFAVGVVVTALWSNDATAVVLTPAVLATTRAARERPLPYLMICAFTANAASFLLPISNPANLVVYAGGMPVLGRWVATFGLASAAALAATYAGLYRMSRGMLTGGNASAADIIGAAELSATGKVALWGMGLAAAAVLTASALGRGLGGPALAAGLVVVAGVSWWDRGVAGDVLRRVPWSVLGLVAGLFVLVGAAEQAGALAAAVGGLRVLAGWSAAGGTLAAGYGVALLSNLINNLPSGLLAGAAVRAGSIGGPVRDAVLVGVDLGPNISVTGSLATILWLIALRREGERVGFLEFLEWGTAITLPALGLALLALLVR